MGEARLRLQEIEIVVQRIKQKQDRELAHLDRRDIDMSPDWQAIAVEDLEKTFDTVDGIANELGGSIPAFAEVGRFPPGRYSPMTDAATKTFNTVEMVRAVRDELSARIATMSTDEENRWLRSTEIADPTLRRLMDLAARGREPNENEDPKVQG